jgi:predicted dehydrogenase
MRGRAAGRPPHPAHDTPTARVSWRRNLEATKGAQQVVRVGVIGTGLMGGIHARAAQDAAGSTLVAVGGGTRAPALGARLGVPVEPSAEALLGRDDLDGVVLATPHTTHLALVEAAAARGLHVLLEKPMGLSVADCDRMIAVCAAAGVTLMVAHISRFLPAVSQAHERIGRGDIGEPRMVIAERLVDGYPNSGWPLDPAEGSAFLDWGSHGCDLMRWLVGAEPEIAFGRTTTFRGTAPTGLSAMATFGFAGGRMGQVWQSYEMAGPGVLARARYVVVGSEGTLDCHAYGQLGLDHGGSHSIVYRADDFPGPGGAADMDGVTFRTAFRDQLAGWVDAIRDGVAPPVTGQDGRTAVAMVLAAEASAATGQAVPVAG